MVTILKENCNGVDITIKADRKSKNGWYISGSNTPININDNEYLRKEAYYIKNAIRNKGKKTINETIVLTAFENVIQEAKKSGESFLRNESKRLKIDHSFDLNRAKNTFFASSKLTK